MNLFKKKKNDGCNSVVIPQVVDQQVVEDRPSEVQIQQQIKGLEQADLEEKERQYILEQQRMNLGKNKIDLACQAVSATIDIAMGVAGCVQLHEKTEQLKIRTEKEVRRLTLKAEIAQRTIDKTFDERAGALNEIYNVLDKTDDKDMTIEAMRSISQIVSKSPLEDIANINEQFNERYDDPTKPLLDF